MAMHCLDPYVPYRVGGHAFNASTHSMGWSKVACGRCAACLRNRKQDWTGRLIMESKAAASMAFLTLTYAEEPEEFEYSHVQTFLKGLRKQVMRRHGAKLRFFCVGERGDIGNRIHWHLLVFFDKRVRLEWTKPGEKWSLWRHGWANIQNLHALTHRVKKIRYCVMYALKDASSRETPRCRGSLMPALGSELLIAHACDVAEAGLALDGVYRIDGVEWDRGHRAGQRQTFNMTGAVRAKAIQAWRDVWEYRYPDREVPTNDWLIWHDKEADLLDPTKRRVLAERGFAFPPVPKAWQPAAAREKVKPTSRFIAGDGWLLLLEVHPGWAHSRVTLDEIHGWTFVHSIGEVLDIPQADINRLDAWVREVRGPQWKGPEYEREARAEEKRREAERKEILRAVIKKQTREEIVRLREKHGVHSTAPGIYRTGYLAERDADAARPVYTSERDKLADLGCYLSQEDSAAHAEGGYQDHAR